MSELQFSKNQKITQLIQKSKYINCLTGVLGLLEWDQEVLMPRNASSARAQQMSILSEISHKALTDEKNGELLNDINQEINSSDTYTLADKALVREFSRHYERETKLPVEFVKEFTEHTSKSLETWREAHEKSDFSIFADDLAKLVDLSIQKAEYYGFEESPYNALLDIYEQGLTEKKVSEIFDPLKEFTINLVERIKNSDVQINSSILNRHYPVKRQMQFSKDLAEGIGYNFDSGRLDKSTHPFTAEFGTINDVRITTRYFESEVNSSIMATIHESGHALYEQGINPEFDSTHLGTGISLGIHESQSRMWENFIGRTPEFWQYWYPRFVTYFEDTVNLNEEEEFVRALNKVAPSFIRVEADEVTYNLHIILRFEIERDLINGKIKVKDLPEVWNSKMEEYLGIAPSKESDGVLQDIHWAMGGIGYFPTYTLGNLYAAQFWHTINKEIPGLPDEIASGNTQVLLDWLRNKIHTFGAVYQPLELCKRITGESLSPKYLEDYLSNKFCNVYNL